MVYDEEWYAGTASKGTYHSFEIVTDQEAVVLRGNRDEATDQVLTGKVVLNLKAATSGKVKLRLSRRLRHTQRIAQAGDPFGQPAAVDLVFNERDIWEDYLVPEAKKLGAGEHSWPFSIPIPADTAASLEGPASTYVVYRLKCTVERGVLQKDFNQKKHVRVHRTFNPDSLALQQAMVTDSHWEGKCSYVISTPTKGVIYGTHVPMEFKLAPLGKGIRPVRAKTTITQVTRFHKSKYTQVPFSNRDVERDVCEDLLNVPGDLEQDIHTFYTVKQNVPLPKDLAKCCQTYKESSISDIEIRHYVNYKLAILNPDGHVSEIQGRLPIHLFFTQSMHVEGTAVSGLPESSAQPMRDAMNDIPPDYNHIHLDALYENVNVSGYATPAPQSGAMTPQRGASFSELDILAEADDENGDYEAHANALRNRLDNEINPISAGTSPTDIPNANALRRRLEQINIGTSRSAKRNSRHGAGAGSAGASGSWSGAHSPNAMARNRSFHGSMGHSPLANMSMTPNQEIANPLDSMMQPQPARAATVGHGPALRVSPPHSGDQSGTHSPDHLHSGSGGSGSATPGGMRSALPTRPSSPVHFEELNRVPSYKTAVATPAPSGAYGSQHGGDGLPTYFDLEGLETASRNGSVNGTGGVSRNGSVNGNTAVSGDTTPATERSGSTSTGVNEAANGSAHTGPSRPGLAEQGRSKSGIFGGLLHYKNK